MNGPTFAGPSAMTRPTAPPRPAAPARPAVRSGNEPAGFPLLTWLRLHWLMILFCGTLLGGGLAYAAWNLLPSEYESYALLRVASAPFSVASANDPNRSKTDFATYIKTNSQLIKYEFVLNAALNRPQSGNKEDLAGPRIADLTTLRDQREPLKYLDEKLLVSASDGSEVIRIAMKGHNPADLQKIVNAVQLAYMDEVIEREIKERADFLTKVEKALVSLTEQVAKRVGAPPDPTGVVPPAALPGVANQLPPLAPNGPPESVKRVMNQLLIQQVAALKQQIEQLPHAIQSQKSKVEALKKQIDGLMKVPVTKEMIDAVENDPEVKELAAKAVYYRAKYRHDAATYSNPDAPVIRASLVEAEQAEAKLAQVKQKKAFEMEVARRQGKAGDLYDEFNKAARLLQEKQEQLQIDTKRLSDKEAELAKLPPDPVKEAEKKEAEKKGPLVDTARTALIADDDIYRTMSIRATSLRLDQESPKRVSVLQPASAPLQKDTRKQILATVFAGLMGFALVGLGAVGYEVRVKKVSSLADLKAATPTPVVGVVPWQPDGIITRDPAKRAEVNEAIDKLRSYVAQTWLARGATTVAVTSPLGDEGKAFASFGLASSLAQAGYKTLLVDFDLRNAGLHTLAGVPNEAGASELLRGETDFRRTIQALPSGLHFLPAGKWSDEARQAAVGGRLEALLARLREPFDCVVLHAHSLLTAAETVEVARRCEVVLLCTLYRETKVPLLKRATERVATMEIPYSGIVYLGATPQEALC